GVLVVKLESELDLARIVGSITRRTNLAEGVAVEVAGTGDRHHAVAAKIWSVIVRVVGNVEAFRPELQTETFFDWEVLEKGQVNTLETRTWDLSHTTESVQPGERQAARHTVGIRYAANSQDARLGECSGIAIPG